MLSPLAPGLLLLTAPQPAPVVFSATAAPAMEASPQAAASTPEIDAAQPVDAVAQGAEGSSSSSATNASPPAVQVVGEGQVQSPDDPLEKFNRAGFAAHQTLDRAILRPVAMGYKHVVPKPVRAGIRNVLLNLDEPIVFVNDLLQLKPGRALRTLARFLIDSTLGIGGLIDIAKRRDFNLPHRANGFGDTLGYYGVKPGPYLFLPLVGPTTVRDLLGGGADGIVLPLAVGHPFDQLEYQAPSSVIGGIDERAEVDQDLRTLFDSAVDPYATLRSVYLQDREGEIRALKQHGDGQTTRSPLDQDLSDPLPVSPTPPVGAAAKPDTQASELADPLADPAAPPQAPTETGSRR